MDAKISLRKLYLIFVKIGAILLGGGYVILPILISELCKKRRLIEESELVNYFAISQSLPGIVAANISMFVGYKLRRNLGAIITMLGIITVPFLCIVVLASIFENLTGNLYISGAFRGIGIAVVALIVLTAREVWQKSKKDMFFLIIFSLSLMSLLLLKLSPVVVIMIYTILGIILKCLYKKRSAE